VRKLMELVRSWFRPAVTPEPVKSEMTRRLKSQADRLERLGSSHVRDGYRAAGGRFVERRKVPR
jgi:hypothetical protein